MLMGLCVATVSACATLPSKPVVAPDPVVTTRIERQVLCPGEVTAPIAARPVPPADAVINGNASGMTWLSKVLAYLNLVIARQNDAAATCAKAAASHG